MRKNSAKVHKKNWRKRFSHFVETLANSMINSFDAFGKSFMRIVNKIGPNIDH